MTKKSTVPTASPLEKTSLLSVGAILVSTGITLVDRNVYVGVLFTILGVACIAYREIRKK